MTDVAESVPRPSLVKQILVREANDEETDVVLTAVNNLNGMFVVTFYASIMATPFDKQ